MYLNLLLEVIKKTYEIIYYESFVSFELKGDKICFIKFKNETIKIDNSVGHKYRITFDDYVGTIDKFREFYDEILGFNNYCCDTSNFIDLTESFIDIISMSLLNNK